MKNLLLLLPLLISCQPTKQFCQAQGDYMYEFCYGILGFDNGEDQRKRDENQDSRLDSVQSQLSSLQQEATLLSSQGESLLLLIDNLLITNSQSSSEIASLASQINLIENQIQVNQLTTVNLQLSIGSLQVTIGSISSLLENLSETVDVVTSHLYVKEVIDFCGDHPSKIDEIGLRLSDNSVIVYYQHGSKRFLTSLSPGNWETTDHTNCEFTVHSDMSITW